MIQITSRGVDFAGTQDDLDSLRKQFDRDNYVILPRLFEPTLLEKILQRVEAARFSPREYGRIGHEFRMDDPLTTSVLVFLMNNPALLRLIEKITGQPQLGEFDGRVYRMTNSAEHAFNWHGDAFDQRAVTLSVNLSPQIYDGGGLQLKHCDSEEILQEVHNTGLGDALLFRISRDLVHRVLGVKGDIPKTAFAGWFHKGEDMLPKLGKLSKPSDLARASDEASNEVTVSPKHE